MHFGNLILLGRSIQTEWSSGDALFTKRPNKGFFFVIYKHYCFLLLSMDAADRHEQFTGSFTLH